MRSNAAALKLKMKSGMPIFGTCMCSYTPSLVELAGFIGYEFCRIDNEHAWRKDEILEHMIRASIIGGIVPLVRVDNGDLNLIRKVLEVGAGGVIIPQVKTAKQVEEIVKASKFAPHGTRGYSPLCFAGQYGFMKPADYISNGNNEPLIGVMIENREAVSNIAEISRVEGLDFIMFGPADYSIEIGLDSPNRSNPEVEKAMTITANTCRSNGLSALLPIGPPWKKEAQKHYSMGFNMLELGHDYSCLKQAWMDALSEVRDPS